jgi:predicted MPP superfamily phosphohydrolase
MYFFASLAVALASAWITYLWAVATFPWLTARKRGVAVALAVLCVIPTVARAFIIHWHSQLASHIQTASTIVLVTMVFAAIPIALLHAGLNRAKPKPRPTDRPPEQAGMTRRQVVEGAAGAAFLAGSGSMLGWGVAYGRHQFELCEIAVRIPGLPRVLDGYVIAQVSDIHVGAQVGERELNEGLALVRRARPDLIAVTGDLVDFEPEATRLAARKLVDVAARDGVVATLGNHDYYAGAESVLNALREAGVAPLVDEGRVMRAADSGGFALLGVDDKASRGYGRSGPHLDRALAMVPRELPRILLSHQPATIDLWPGKVALQLSGHTHGGQINPGSRTVNLLFEYLAGSYSVRGTTLYVNRGFGTVALPARVGAPPEVTRIVLVAA